MAPIETPFDGALRHRIHLLRHAQADYRLQDGQAAPEPERAPLTALGREQAGHMRDALAGLEFDFALCSGLERTRETAGIVLAGRDLTLEIEPGLEELRGPTNRNHWGDPASLAYAFHDLDAPDATFAGGENIAAFCERVCKALERQLALQSWRHALFVCHGGTNRAILMWALQAGPEVLGTFEQDNCCLNVIDIDIDPASGEIVRRYLRTVNMTPYDLTKRDIHLTTLESSALQLRSAIDSATGEP